VAVARARNASAASATVRAGGTRYLRDVTGNVSSPTVADDFSTLA